MELLCLGKIVKAQGIKGEVKVALNIDESFSERYPKFVYVEGQRVSVRSFRQSSGYAYIGLSTITDRNQAESLRSKELFIEKGDLELPPERFFVDDIIGCGVYFEDGAFLGNVEDILQKSGVADVYVVRGQAGEVLFPLLKKITLKINVREQKIVVERKAFEQVAVYTDDKNPEETDIDD